MTRYLVTGGAGFIGSNFIRYALAHHRQLTIVNVDLLTYAGQGNNLQDLEGSPRYRLVRADVNDRAALRQAMAGCEAVIHFAAATHVDRSITDPAPFLQTNVLGTAAVVETARALQIPRLLHVSTDEVYGACTAAHGFDEAAPLRPTNPYAASKASADLLVQAAVATHGVPALIVRPANNFGPYQYPEKLIPLFITNALADAPLPVYGDGGHIRDWLHVEDTCAALLIVLARGRAGEAYNVSAESLTANLEVGRQILQMLGKPERLLQHVADRPAHDRRYAMTAGKLRALGWAPRHPFDLALRETVDWYQGHPAWWRPLKERLRADPYHWLDRPAGPGGGRPAPALTHGHPSRPA